MIRIHFEITPSRTIPHDANVRLLNVIRTEEPEDLTHKPEGDEVAIHDNLKTSRSLFTSIRAISMSKLDRMLLKDLIHVGKLSNEQAVNVLLACKREVAAEYSKPGKYDSNVRFFTDGHKHGDNEVYVTLNVKGLKAKRERKARTCA